MSLRSLVVVTTLAALAAILALGCAGGMPASSTDGTSPSTDDAEASLQAAGDVQEAETQRGRDLQTEAAALVAALEASSEFVDAGDDTETDTIWAVTSSGLPINFVRNRFAAWENYVISQEDAGTIVTSAHGAPMPEFGASTRATTELPTGKKAYVMNGLGSCFSNGPALAKLRETLTKAGYIVNNTSPTVANLMTVSDAAVFFINTHGTPSKTVAQVKRGADGSLSPVQDDSTRVGSLWTSTAVTRATLLQYEQMLVDGELVILSAEHDSDGAGGCTTPLHFGITPKFIETHMSFSDDSLVWVQACFSDRADLRDAAFASGAGVYAGWGALTTGNVAFRYFFDRALSGAESGNDFQPETPPQRAFDWQLVYTDLSDQGYHEILQPVKYPWGNVRNDWVNGGIARLVLHPNPASDHGLLLPSIQRLEVKEDLDELHVFGTFGGKQGKVTIDGASVSVKSWTKDKITVDLPRSGAGSYGEVIVELDDRKSNPVPLTEWRGKLTYGLDGPGTLEYKFEWDLHIRGDVHTFRDEPGAAPTIEKQAIMLSQDTKAKLSASGSYTTTSNGKVKESRWRGGQTIPWSPNTNSPPSQTHIGEVRPKADGSGFADPTAAKLVLTIVASASHTIEGYENGALEGSADIPVTMVWFGDFADETLAGTLPAVVFDFDSQWNIKARKRTVTVGDGDLTLEWTQLTAKGAPEKTQARAAR